MTHLITSDDLVAAVPALLGYIPVDQLVTVYLKAAKVEVVSAVTLDHDSEEVATGLIGVAARIGSDALCLIAVGGAAFDLADVVAEGMIAAGIQVLTVLHAGAVSEGGMWTDLRTGATGRIADPAAHPMAVAGNVDGTPTARSRAEIVSWYALACEVPGPDAADLAAPISEFAHRVLTELLAVITANGYACDDLAARTAALVLRSETARDAVVGLGTGAPAVAARVLTDIANRVRGAMRAELLTLVAILWYSLGHGVAARIAIDEATDTVSDSGQNAPSLLAMLDFAYRISLPPTEVSKLIVNAAELAREAFGIELPANH